MGSRTPMLMLLLAAALLGCRPPAAGPIEPTLPSVDAAQPVYAGAWIGPELSLHFVGPWVFVRPTADPSAAPIELRATVERESGDAHALRTSLASVWPASFLRPSDWTLLVEDGQLAIAMGDEPLTAYVHADAPPLLRGPVMLDELLPAAGLDEPGMADGVACLELANDRCVELEAGASLVAGCRELEWTLCATTLTPLPADPIERAAELSARRIHARTLELRFAEAVVSAAPAELRGAAEALRERVRASARATLDDIARDGPLPSDDPHLAELLARLET